MLFAEDLVIIGSDTGEGHVYAFEARTGAVRWKLRAGRGVPTDILRSGDNLFAATLEDSLLCIDLATGRLNWSFRAAVIPDTTFSLTPSPTLGNGLVYFGARDGWVYAFEESSGLEFWSVPLESQIVTSMLLRNDALFTATADGRVHRLNSLTGEKEAMLETGGRPRGALVPAGNRIIAYRASDAWEGELIAFDPRLEGILWEASPPEGSKWTAARPFLLENQALTGSQDGLIYAVDPADGSIAWTKRIEGTWKDGDGVRVFGRHDATLFVGTISGMLYALRLQEP